MRFNAAYFAFLSTIVLACAVPTFAAENEKIAKFKDAIVENCDRAIATFDSSFEEDHGDIVSYLMEVLHLQLGGPNDMVPVVPPPVTGRGSVDGNPMARMDIWRSFDPDFELKAKGCALRVLRKLGSESVEALGSLVTLARERTLPDEFRAALEDTTMTIAGLSEQKFPSSAVVRQIAGEVQPDARNQAFARLVLERLGSRTVPDIFAVMIERTECARDKLRAVMKKLDPTYSQIPALMMHELSAPEPAVRQTALESVPDFAAYYCSNLSEVVPMLEDPHAATRDIAESAMVQLSARIEDGSDKDTCQPKIVPKFGCDPKAKAALSKILSTVQKQGGLSLQYAGLLNTASLSICISFEDIKNLANDERAPAHGELGKVLARYVEVGRVGKNHDEIATILLKHAIADQGEGRDRAVNILKMKNLKIKNAVQKARKDPAFSKQLEFLAYLLVERGEGNSADKKLAAKYTKGT